MNSALLPSNDDLISSFASILSFNSGTWDIIPTSLPPFCNAISELIALSNDSESNVPNPSSINIVSNDIPPAFAWTTSDNPNANDKEALKLSPPDKVFTCLHFPV